LRSELLRSVFLIFWGQKNELGKTCKLILLLAFFLFLAHLLNARRVKSQLIQLIHVPPVAPSVPGELAIPSRALCVSAINNTNRFILGALKTEASKAYASSDINPPPVKMGLIFAS
jgi:hypothetical protein